MTLLRPDDCRRIDCRCATSWQPERDQGNRYEREAATADGRVTARLGSAPKPDAVLTGATPLVWQLLTGKLNLTDARKAGLMVEGKAAALTRFGVLASEKTPA